MPRCQSRIRCSRLLWKIWTRSTNLKRSGPKKNLSLPMTRTDNFSSNDSLSLCRDSTLSCCTSHLEVTTTRTFSRPAFLISLDFNPRDLHCRGYNNNNKLCAWRHNMSPPLLSPPWALKRLRAAELTQWSSTFPRRIRSHVDRSATAALRVK